MWILENRKFFETSEFFSFFFFFSFKRISSWRGAGYSKGKGTFFVLSLERFSNATFRLFFAPFVTLTTTKSG